jgi:hypothetical protein
MYENLNPTLKNTKKEKSIKTLGVALQNGKKNDTKCRSRRNRTVAPDFSAPSRKEKIFL